MTILVDYLTPSVVNCVILFHSQFVPMPMLFNILRVHFIYDAYIHEAVDTKAYQQL